MNNLIEVGDTVRVTGHKSDKTFNGEIGKALSLFEYWGRQECSVEFENDIGGHDGCGYSKGGKFGHVWNVDPDMLTLIRKAKPEQKTEPEGFSVGDRVADERSGALGRVVSITGEVCGGLYPVEVLVDYGPTLTYTLDGRQTIGRPITLKHKEEPKMSKRPNLSEINERTLVKLRGYGLCALVEKENGLTLENAKCMGIGHGIGQISQYGENFAPRGLMRPHPEYDIVAVKQMRYVGDVLAAVLSGTEPDWDWTEQMDRPPEPVKVTAADLKKQFGQHIVLDLDGQRLEVK